MTTFAVFGNAYFACKKKADKKCPKQIGIKEADGSIRAETLQEWAARRDDQAKEFFNQGKIYQISPAFDSPKFAEDWIKVGAGEISNAVIKCRIQKVDEIGRAVLKKGVPVMTWRDWDEVKKEKRIK